MSLHTHNNPLDFKCPHCGAKLNKRTTMANPTDGQMHKGMVQICAYCTGAMILGNTEWRKMTQADFKAMPPGTQRALVTMVRGLEQTLNAGKEWSPYDSVRRN